jgi:hypothetical protein
LPKTLYVLKDFASEEIFGACYSWPDAMEWAGELGPGVSIAVWQENEGKNKGWKLLKVYPGKEAQAADLTQAVTQERQAIVARLGLTDGLLYEAITQGLTPAQAQASFEGKTPGEILGTAADPWNDPAVQAEFGGDRQIWEAFCRAEAQGQVRIFGRRRH